MYINRKETENKITSLKEQLNIEIKDIAKKRLAKKDLGRTARQILEEILEENTESPSEAA